MAYSNNNRGGASRSYAGRFITRITKGGKNAGRDTDYISFTVVDKKRKIACTYRVYYTSSYTPSTGKKAGVESCPVTATYFKLNDNNMNDCPIF